MSFISKKGFTLIELLAVIAIIGILASIVLVSLSGAKASSRDAKRIADLKSIQIALQLYYNDNLKYPNSSISNTGTPGNITKELVPIYLSTMPQDPKGGSYAFKSYTTNSGGNCVTSVPVLYHMGAVMETTNMPSDDVDRNANPTGYYVCGSGGLPGTDFLGESTLCDTTSASGSADRCYDVVNN
jgi:type II secretion system protein G